MPARHESEARRRTAGPIVDSKAEAVAELMLEVAQCFFRIRAVGAKTGLITSWGGGAFGFIRSLALLGPLTVPQIAQMRPTSRRRMQRLANELAAEGLMEFVDNPKHRRSKLVRLTPKGDARYLELNARLLSIASTMGVALGEVEIRATTEMVRQLRKALPLGMTRPVGDQRMQRRLAAIVAADAVGYSRLMEGDEQGTLVRLNSLRREVFQPKIKQHGGRVFKTTGDGLLVEFQSAVDAVESAIEIQRAVAARNQHLAPSQRLTLRIGVSLGDVIVEGGGDLYGNGVNIAARMQALAEPGGICISGNVHEHVDKALDVGFEDLGNRHVKNLDRPIRCYRVHPKATAGGARGLDTRDRHRQSAVPGAPRRVRRRHSGS